MPSPLLATSVAQELESLAADPRFERREAGLRDLATSLKDPDSDDWTGIDLNSAFAPESVMAPSVPSAKERWLGLAAGVSVFVPVAWTWWGFSSAASAYRDMLATEGEKEGSTFLGQWTTGFDGRLAEFHHLVPTALGSLAFIVLVMMLVALHRGIAERAVKREESELQDARAELAAVLTRAQVVLNGRRADHPSRVADIIAGSLKKLKQAHSQTQRSVAELEEVHKVARTELGNAVVAVAESARLLEVALTKADATVSAIEHSNEAFSQNVTQALTVMDQSVSTSMGAVENAVNATTTGLTRAVKENLHDTKEALATASTNLTSGLDASLADFHRALGAHVVQFTDRAVTEVTRAGASLGSVAAEMSSSAQANREAAAELTSRVGEMAEDNAATRDTMVASLEGVRDTLAGIEDALDRHEGVLQGQTSELAGARDQAERLIRRLNLAAAAV